MSAIIREICPIPHNFFESEALGLGDLLCLLPLLELVLDWWAFLHKAHSADSLKICRNHGNDTAASLTAERVFTLGLLQVIPVHLDDVALYIARIFPKWSLLQCTSTGISRPFAGIGPGFLPYPRNFSSGPRPWAAFFLEAFFPSDLLCSFCAFRRQYGTVGMKSTAG